MPAYQTLRHQQSKNRQHGHDQFDRNIDDCGVPKKIQYAKAEQRRHRDGISQDITFLPKAMPPEQHGSQR